MLKFPKSQRWGTSNSVIKWCFLLSGSSTLAQVLRIHCQLNEFVIEIQFLTPSTSDGSVSQTLRWSLILPLSLSYRWPTSWACPSWAAWRPASTWARSSYLSLAILDPPWVTGPSRGWRWSWRPSRAPSPSRWSSSTQLSSHRCLAPRARSRHSWWTCCALHASWPPNKGCQKVRSRVLSLFESRQRILG